MKELLSTISLAALLLVLPPPAAAQSVPAAGAARPEWVLVIHGGAGTITRENMDPGTEHQYTEAMSAALEAGRAILEAGGSSIEAVEAAIRVMEDSPLFNAGKGAVFTHNGLNELDAGIMDGAARRAGAVIGVSHIKNPISLARLVMERSRHVVFAREGAEEFALEQAMELVPTEYFFTERRWQALMQAREREAAAAAETTTTSLDDPDDSRYGTVGAVALDRRGALAAGTSTGGLTNKRFGRVGDVPIIGAGTYADETCAISATGTGEYFIRNVVAFDICARSRYSGIPLRDAADHVIMDVLPSQGGDGGVIALDAEGEISMPFNTAGMYRGFLVAGGRPVVEFYRD